MILRFALFICIGIHLGSGAYSQYSSTTTDMNKNWVVTKNMKQDGSVKAIEKQYFDNNGNTTQCQVRNMNAGQILATQVITDAYGRQVLKTLPAALNTGEFGFKSNFVVNGSGTNYNFMNFDDAKTNNPDAIGGQSTPGTLGWYYSNNNTLELRVATSSYPYTRSDFYKDGTGKGKRGAGLGEAFRMGQGREVSGYATPVANELDHYLTVRNKYYTAAEVGGLPTTLAGQATQEVARDVNGKEVICMIDRDGKVLMTARPGTGLTVNNSTTVNALSYQFVLSTINFDAPFSHFTIKDNGAEGVVVLSGSVVYTGPLSGYTPPVTQFLNLTIMANKRFLVSYQVDNIYGNPPLLYPDVASSEVISNEVHYFKILNDAGSTVTVTPDPTYGGTYDLYNMSTEQLVAGFTGTGTLAKGYYKLVVKRGKVTLAYSNSYDEITYSYYNHSGQLLSTIAPEGVKKLIQNINAYPARTNVPFINILEYDTRGRLIASTEADGGRSEFIFTRSGKIRFSQNAKQRVFGWFSYTNFDATGRPIESGEYHPSGDVTFTGLKTNNTIIEDVSSTGGLPIIANKYEWMKIKYDVEDNTHGLGGYTQTFVRSAVSMTESTDSKTWYSYDDMGKVVWVIKWISGLGYKTTNYYFDIEGKLAKMVYQKDVAAETFVHYYEYDADERLSMVYTNTVDNPGTKQLQEKYYYYVHGPVKRVEMATNLQGLDYTYTLDGKLKAMNHSDITKDPGNDNSGTNGFLPDAFGELLEYYASDYVRSGTNIGSITINTANAPEQYGGQIRGMSWFSKKPLGSGLSDVPTMYVYKYDARYQFAEATWGSISAGNFVPDPSAINKEIVSSYDLHGNIQNINRTNGAGATTDNFLYNYVQTPKPTNRLGSITQQTSGQNYATYQYDDIGQLSSEVPGPAYGSAISKYLQYDVSGKVKGVYTNSGLTTATVKFVYDENGRRIKKLSHNAGGTLISTTYYVYEAGGKLASVYEQPNGGAVSQKEIPVHGDSRFAMYYRNMSAYRYELADHLGNVRAVFLKTVTNNIDVVVSRDYYPFGSPVPNREYSDATGYRYGFQGQYSEKDVETMLNAYELRMYDPKIGRWLSVDPEGEFWSPYIGMGNDPVNFADPDGGCLSPECRARRYQSVMGGQLSYSEKTDKWLVTRVTDNSTIIVTQFGKLTNQDMRILFTLNAIPRMEFNTFNQIPYKIEEEYYQLKEFYWKREAQSLQDMVKLSALQAPNVVLTGAAIDKLNDDPGFQEFEQNALNYFKSGNSGEYVRVVGFGGKRGRFISLLAFGLTKESRRTYSTVTNELTWMVRNATVVASAQFHDNGSVTISYELRDRFDLSAQKGRGFAYNIISAVGGTVYHFGLGNSAPVVRAYWSKTY